MCISVRGCIFVREHIYVPSVFIGFVFIGFVFIGLEPIRRGEYVPLDGYGIAPDTYAN